MAKTDGFSNANTTDNYTTIAISKKNKDLLAKRGQFGQSYDNIISKLLNNLEDQE